jgi:ADP-heptose:LPS heptosyltransferase
VKKALDQLPPGSRVAIIRLRSLGDCVLSTPAIHLLKAFRPDLELAAVAEPRFAAVYENNPEISAVLPPDIRSVRGFAAELCLNLHGGTRSARLTALSGASWRAGFDIFKPSWIYNLPIPTAQETLGITRRVHTAEHAASAIFHLGVPITEVPRARLFAEPGRTIEGAYAVIHPFAATPEKTWGVGSFLRVAESLEMEPVFIGGPDDDLTPFSKFRTIADAPLGEIARLMRDASLFVGNDSGPAHIAAAFGRPQVVLFGPSDAEIWSPWRAPSLVLQAMPMDDISVEQVIRAIEKVLS